jgi:hypothetical protein
MSLGFGSLSVGRVSSRPTRSAHRPLSCARARSSSRRTDRGTSTAQTRRPARHNAASQQGGIAYAARFPPSHETRYPSGLLPN